MRAIAVFMPLLMTIASPALAHPDHMAAPVLPKEFETMKKLVGTWEGTSKMGPGGKEETVKVVYELTSGGTAIAEKLMPGTPKEMTTMYYGDGKTMAMTHYCAIGNHPEMKLKKAEANTLAFEMVGHNGIKSPKEMHMHALTLTMVDDNTLKQEWVNYTDGKKAETVVFTVKRKM